MTTPDGNSTRYLSKNSSGTFFAFYANTNQNVDIYLIPANVVEQVATPTITGEQGATEIPAQGTLSVTLACATDGATIHYTTNGDTPTAESATYTTPLSLDNACTVKAMAVKGGMITSEVASREFTKVGGPKTATASFGNGEGCVQINSASVSFKDSQKNDWTCSVVGTTSFTPSSSQIGSGIKPATSITFSTTFESSVTVNSFSMQFGGFGGTVGSISVKVGTTEIASGSLNGTNDVTVATAANYEAVSGTTITITVTGIDKGVKVYGFSFVYV